MAAQRLVLTLIIPVQVIGSTPALLLRTQDQVSSHGLPRYYKGKNRIESNRWRKGELVSLQYATVDSCFVYRIPILLKSSGVDSPFTIPLCGLSTIIAMIASITRGIITSPILILMIRFFVKRIKVINRTSGFPTFII